MKGCERCDAFLLLALQVLLNVLIKNRRERRKLAREVMILYFFFSNLAPFLVIDEELKITVKNQVSLVLIISGLHDGELLFYGFLR